MKASTQSKELRIILNRYFELFSSCKRLTEKCKLKRNRERVSKKEILSQFKKLHINDDEISVTGQMSTCDDADFGDCGKSNAVTKMKSCSNAGGSSNDFFDSQSSKGYRESLASHRQDSWAVLDLDDIFCASSPIVASQVVKNGKSSSFETISEIDNYSDVGSSIETGEDSKEFDVSINDLMDNSNHQESRSFGMGIKCKEEADHIDFDSWLEEMENFASTLKKRGYDSNEAVKLCMSAHQGAGTVTKFPTTIVTRNRISPERSQNNRITSRAA